MKKIDELQQELQEIKASCKKDRPNAENGKALSFIVMKQNVTI